MVAERQKPTKLLDRSKTEKPSTTKKKNARLVQNEKNYLKIYRHKYYPCAQHIKYIIFTIFWIHGSGKKVEKQQKQQQQHQTIEERMKKKSIEQSGKNGEIRKRRSEETT